MSKDVVAVSTLLGSLVMLKLMGGVVVEQADSLFATCFYYINGNYAGMLPTILRELSAKCMTTVAVVAGPFLGVTAILAVAATFAQTKLLVTGESLKPKFNRISPLQGFKRLFSLRSVIEALKGILNRQVFDENFLKEIAEMKEKNFALELLKRLLEEHIKKYAKKRMVEAEKFSEMLDARLAEYLRGLISNEEVIKELLKMAQELKANAGQASELGLTEEEQAFYDALTKPQAVRDFYENSQLVAMAKELTEALRSSKTIDWRQKESARAKMRSMVKRLLKKYKYPPEEQEAALETVIRQCELYADSDNES